MDAAEAAFWAAVTQWVPLVIAAAATFVIAWFGKQTMLKKAARTAALDAEKSVGTGPGLGPRKKVFARETMMGTMSGKFSTVAAIDAAIEDHGMKAVQRASEPPPEAPSN